MKTGKVFVGTIIASVPETGIALVSTAPGTPNLDSIYISALPVTDSDVGVVQQANYPDGTAVLCVKAQERDRAYIVAPANYAMAYVHDSLAGSALYRVDEYTDVKNKTFRQLQCDLLVDNYKNVCYQAHGEDLNVLPGDWDVMDTTGNNGLHVGRTITQFRGSAFAFIDAVGLTNTIRVVAQNIEKHMPFSIKLSSKELEVEDFAVSDAEAFGFLEGQPLEVVDNMPQLKDEFAIPLYRIQSVAGAAADGCEKTIVGFPGAVHDCKTEPPVLAKQRVSLSGALSSASAASVLSVKSPAIEALMQVYYSPDRDRQEQSDILQPYQLKEEQEEEQEPYDIDDIAIHKILDKLFSDDYVGLLLSKLAEHGLSVTKGDGSIEKAIEGEFETGPSNLQEYNLPPSIKLKDPVSGKETTYYASTSFISQEPDGSILICDGYGSEIRMLRGNIFISPALDLFFRPGRDLSSMAPRYQSFNAQKHTTINSSESVYIRAANDCKVVAATAGDGVLTLENKATTERSSGNGILVKSTTGLSLLGTDVYIGRARNDSQVKNRVEEPEQAGSIIIDAGSNGIIYERSAAQTLDSIELDLVSDQMSAIRIANNMIGLYSEGVEITGHVVVATKTRPEIVTLWRDSQPQQFQLVQATDPSVSIDGSLGVDGNIICNESMKLCGDLYVQNVATSNGEVYMVSYQNGNPFEREPFDKLEGRADMGYFATEVIKVAAQYIYQDYYTAVNSFSFPQYNVALTVMPGMMWQADNIDNNVGSYWKEEAVISVLGNTETLCYPGNKAWNEAKVSYRKEKRTLNGGYVTNT